MYSVANKIIYIYNFVQHAGYSSSGGYPNDIAMLKFTNIPTNGNTGYIAMATTGDSNFAGASCVITGWGRTNIGGMYINIFFSVNKFSESMCI